MTIITKTFPNSAAADAFNPPSGSAGTTAYKNTDGTYTVAYDDGKGADTGSSAPTVGRTASPAAKATTRQLQTTVTANAPTAAKSKTTTSSTPTVDDGGSAPTVSVATGTLPNSVAPVYINTMHDGVYKPRIVVYADNVLLGIPIKAEYSLNNAYQADKWYIEFALGQMPSGYGAAYWADGQQKKITISVGEDSKQFSPVIIGYVDESDTDWKTLVLKIRGRDLSSGPLDTKSSEKYSNMSSSQIANIIAAKYGLTADITATTTLVGQFYIREHAKLTSDITEHDLLTYLAEQEGFNYWIKLNTLHFKPADPPTNQVFGIFYKPGTNTTPPVSNFFELTTTRSETLAKDIKVTVLSWNSKSKRQIKAVVTRSRTKSAGKATKATADSATVEQGYVLSVPNLTQQQAEDYAAKKAKEFSSHERKITAEMPVDFALNPRTQVALVGTNTAWDQSYFIDSLEFAASFEAGFTMTIHAKNHSPQTQTTV